MGADGGSIPDRSDMVKTKARTRVTDKDILREIFFLCALSKRPLVRPVVLDPLGKLYNKDAIIEFFLDRSKYGDGDRICGYLKGVKDLLTLNLFPNPEYTAPTASTTNNIPSRSPFVCPLSFKELSGTVPFIALRPCGCVFTDAAIRGIIPNLTKGLAAKVIPKEQKEEKPDAAIPVVEEKKGTVACPNCGTYFDPTLPSAITPIHPPKEVQDVLLEHLLTTRAAAKSGKKRKAEVGLDSTESQSVKASKPKAAGARQAKENERDTDTNGMARTVKQKLADQEVKRLKAQEGMSDAVRAMFKSKDGDQRGTGGAADFFGRTFTRYAA